MKGVFLHDWDNVDNLVSDFESEEPRHVEILLASYTYEDYSGNAFVLFRKGTKLYEVNGGHCSCYGLEGQWEPEETNAEALRHRIKANRKERPYDNEYWDDLEEVLNALDNENNAADIFI